MPLTNWSTTGGDLRAAHFFGLHGLQAMLLAGIGFQLLAGRFRRLRDEVVRVRLVTVAACGYGGLVVLTTWQALRGQPLIHPDAVTLIALGGILAAAGLGAVLAMTGRRQLSAVLAPGAIPTGGKIARIDTDSSI
jgi:hypothetical protein